MNRREIIIVGVLMNAILLVALFLFGIKQERKLTIASVSSHQENASIEREEFASLPKKIELPALPLFQIEQKIQKEGEELAQLSRQREGERVLSADRVSAEKVVDKEESTPTFSKAPPSFVEHKQDEKGEKITVGKGDMLEKLAKQHRVSVKEIMALNRLTSTKLQIGQLLLLPRPKEKEEREARGEEGEYYTVKAGDSPWTIAHKAQLPVEELLRLNGLDQEKAKRLKPGDRLRIK